MQTTYDAAVQTTNCYKVYVKTYSDGNPIAFVYDDKANFIGACDVKLDDREPKGCYDLGKLILDAATKEVFK